MTFVVEGRRVHGLDDLVPAERAVPGHVCLDGRQFREATQREIELHDITYEAFLRMMHYLYTGKVPEIEVAGGATPGCMLWWSCCDGRSVHA